MFIWECYHCRVPLPLWLPGWVWTLPSATRSKYCRIDRRRRCQVSWCQGRKVFASGMAYSVDQTPRLVLPTPWQATCFSAGRTLPTEWLHSGGFCPSVATFSRARACAAACSAFQVPCLWYVGVAAVVARPAPGPISGRALIPSLRALYPSFFHQSHIYLSKPYYIPFIYY